MRGSENDFRGSQRESEGVRRSDMELERVRGSERE